MTRRENKQMAIFLWVFLGFVLGFAIGYYVRARRTVYPLSFLDVGRENNYPLQGVLE